MGVDAIMFFQIKEKPTKTQLKHWSYALGQRFGKDRFWIFRKENRHILSLIDPSGDCYQERDEVVSYYGVPYTEYMVNVNLASRYYGPGYERGDFPTIYLVWKWIKFNIPGVVVYYGGDSDSEFEEATEISMNGMLEYFLKEGNDPYRRGWQVLVQDDLPTPPCDFCEMPMIRHSWGEGTGKWDCPGCGFEMYTTDYGTTYHVVKEKV